MAEIKIEKRCAWSDPIDPTLVNNPINAMAEVVGKAVRSVPSCLPARILSYDRVSHTAIVQPLCNAMTNTGDSVERPPIKIHVIRFASGLHKVEDLTQPNGYRIVPGAIIDLPLAIGDTGWIIASDADTQAQKAANAHYFKDEDAGPLNPSTGLIHSFMHGVFIPDSFCSFPKIAEFGDQMVIGTYTYDEENEEAVITPISFSGGGDGGGGMFAWTPPAAGESTGTIGPGGCMVGRRFIECTNGIGSGKSVGTLYSLKITLGASLDTALEVVSNAFLGQSPSGNVSYIPIYMIGSDGKISADYRGAFVVPAYE